MLSFFMVSSLQFTLKFHMCLFYVSPNDTVQIGCQRLSYWGLPQSGNDMSECCLVSACQIHIVVWAFWETLSLNLSESLIVPIGHIFMYYTLVYHRNLYLCWTCNCLPFCLEMFVSFKMKSFKFKKKIKLYFHTWCL